MRLNWSSLFVLCLFCTFSAFAGDVLEGRQLSYNSFGARKSIYVPKVPGMAVIEDFDIFYNGKRSVPGKKAAPTRVEISRDAQWLYLHVIADEPLKVRDNNKINNSYLWRGDLFEIFFGDVEPEPWCMQFVVGAGGGRFSDAIPLNAWKAISKVHAKGYELFVSIPLKILKKNQSGIGFNIGRQRYRELSSWTKLAYGFHEPENYGELLLDDYENVFETRYLEQNINKVPVDDDITYVILNLLCLEKYGKNYTVEDMGKLWLDILPIACTAEDEALQQMRAGTRPECAANFNNYVELIGAAIRADAFGYVEAGNPVAAAKLSYPDAYLTHRKNGIYGEMFCAAAVAAAFTAETPLDAIKVAMTQIPKECELYQALEWAFSVEDKVTNYLRARELLDEKFKRMSPVHTINNMCAIVFSFMLGGNDFQKCISECIAIGLDNDCTGATVGSIAGACLGFEAIPAYWYEKFNNTVKTYLTGV